MNSAHYKDGGNSVERFIESRMVVYSFIEIDKLEDWMDGETSQLEMKGVEVGLWCFGGDFRGKIGLIPM